MKGKLLFSIIILFLLNINFLKAQDDPNCGIYADGVKVTELSCYSFKKLTVVFPYNPSYEKFDKIRVYVCVGTNFDDQYQDQQNWLEIMPAALFKYKKGNYFVCDVFVENNQDCFGTYDGYTHRCSRGGLAYYAALKQPEGKFFVKLFGNVQTGTKEEYNEYCKCVKVNPIYDATDLAGPYNVNLTNRKKLSPLSDYPFNKTVDLSVPCEIAGTKVDFNNLGGSSPSTTTSSTTNASSNTTMSSNNASSSTSTTTNMTALTAKDANELSPLDKKKPGYYKTSTEEGYKVNGKKEGEWRKLDEYTPGMILEVHHYKSDVEDGLYVEYYTNGKIHIIGNYVNGKKEGKWLTYEDDGSLYNTKNFVNGYEQ